MIPTKKSISFKQTKEESSSTGLKNGISTQKHAGSDDQALALGSHDCLKQYRRNAGKYETNLTNSAGSAIEA